MFLLSFILFYALLTMLGVSIVTVKLVAVSVCFFNMLQKRLRVTGIFNCANAANASTAANASDAGHVQRVRMIISPHY